MPIKRVGPSKRVGWLLYVNFLNKPGLSSLGVPGVPWHTQILADHLTLFQPGGTDFAHLITTGTPGFSDLPTALQWREIKCQIYLVNEDKNGSSSCQNDVSKLAWHFKNHNVSWQCLKLVKISKLSLNISFWKILENFRWELVEKR